MHSSLAESTLTITPLDTSLIYISLYPRITSPKRSQKSLMKETWSRSLLSGVGYQQFMCRALQATSNMWRVIFDPTLIEFGPAWAGAHRKRIYLHLQLYHKRNRWTSLTSTISGIRELRITSQCSAVHLTHIIWSVSIYILYIRPIHLHDASMTQANGIPIMTVQKRVRISPFVGGCSTYLIKYHTTRQLSRTWSSDICGSQHEKISWIETRLL